MSRTEDFELLLEASRNSFKSLFKEHNEEFYYCTLILSIKVYNLEVADFNTYFVGNEAVLVHNYENSDGNGSIGYPKKDHDIDLRGSRTGYRDALDIAFEHTGQPGEKFMVSKWARDANGKSIPVEYIGPDGSYVDIDFAHSPSYDRKGMWATGPDSPHIGWTSGKNNKTTGHILIDAVPTGRDYAYSDQEKQVISLLKMHGLW